MGEAATLWRKNMNPIWKREFFARWRDWRSHLLLLALALLLSGAAYWSYRNALEYSPPSISVYRSGTGRYSPVPVVESLATRGSRAGHALFSTLTIGNVLVWFVLAPLLTATGIARERERGLLESLQLSRMSPRSQVVSRAVSALFYLLVLQLVTLPVYFVAFSFGGISPGEIGRSWLVVGFAAWCGIGLGLMLSAGASRPSGALFGAVALICGWSLAAWLGLIYCLSPWGLLGLGGWTRPIAQVLYWSHPVTVAFWLCEPGAVRPTNMYAGYGGTIYTSIYGSVGGIWNFALMFPLCLLAWFCVGMVGLAKAARDVTRAFAPSGWAGRNTLVEKWKRERQKRIEAQRERASAKMEGALLADLPFDKWIRFKNPLLNREVKSRFRLRRASAFIWLARSAVFVFAVGGWVMAMALLLDPIDRAGGAPILLWMELILGAALVGTFAASGFAREREAGTWEGVRLSLLSNRQIALTKWASPLIAFALLTCPLWVLLFFFVPFGGGNGMPFRLIASGAVVVAVSLAFVSALATWISLRARNTTTATCWTLGMMVVLFCALPLAWSSFGLGNWSVQQITGVPPVARSSYSYVDYSWRELLQVRQRYVLETGRPAPQLIMGRGYSNPNEIERYWAWCEMKQKEAIRVADLASVWSPMLVLDEFGNVKSNNTNRSLSNDDIALMGLVHSFFGVVGAVLLLWGVTRRLNSQLD